MSTIGQKLGDKRIERGLTVNDVAHVTRIHPNIILSIEEDDFSNFPSVSYAKSFLRLYSEHLGIDLSTSMDHLNNGTTWRLKDSEMMREMKKTIRKDRLFRLQGRYRSFRRRPDKPGGTPLFLNFVLFLLVAALGIFYFLGFNASTIEEAKSDIASGLSKAIRFGGTPGSDPGASNAVAKPAVTLPPDENLPVTPSAEILPLRPRTPPQLDFTETPTPPGTTGLVPGPALNSPPIRAVPVTPPE